MPSKLDPSFDVLPDRRESAPNITGTHSANRTTVKKFGRINGSLQDFLKKKPDTPSLSKSSSERATQQRTSTLDSSPLESVGSDLSQGPVGRRLSLISSDRSSFGKMDDRLKIQSEGV